MRILWVNPHFLHPTTRGGQIRTLEMLRQLHRRHEIHYAALEDPNEPEGVRRSPEYCTKAYPIPHHVPKRGSPAFIAQAFGNLASSMPLAVSRYASVEMRTFLTALCQRERFDCIVCDFLFAAPGIPRLDRSVLFQHNVEAMIWRRHAANAGNPLAKLFFRVQAARMVKYEREVCRQVSRVIAVSPDDARTMERMYGIREVADVPTGVNLEYFQRDSSVAAPVEADLIFVGSMDWLPNVDGVRFMVREILPLIRKAKPDCRLAIVGRTPTEEILEFGRLDPLIQVTGTVPDVRPYLWGSAISVIPLRIGGGTRLKIFEAMAARVPVVSTTIGAEGLPIRSGEHCYLADSPGDFSDRCLELLSEKGRREAIAASAWELVASQFSWETVSKVFERLLSGVPAEHA